LDDLSTIGSVSKPPYDAEARRRVLQAFIERNKLKVQTWTNASGLSEAGLRAFLAARADSMSDRTYEKLAAGAAKLLRQPIAAATLRGDKPATVSVPVFHYIGLGDEIYTAHGGEPLSWTEAPPSHERSGGVGVVQGDHMRPAYEDKDLLFWRQFEAAPAKAPRRPVVVKIKDGPLVVKKLLPISKKGRFHLLSVNPMTPPLEDQLIEVIARIDWVKLVE
jgi:hypothetical protein